MTLEEYFAAWSWSGMSFDEKMSVVKLGFLIVGAATGYAAHRLMEKKRKGNR